MSLDPARERYVSLATFRKSGKEVRTPVWIAVDGQDPKRCFVYTNRTSGKVKRIRAGSAARLAACDARGKVRGDWQAVEARMLDDAAEVERGFDVILGKYGWQMRMALLASRVSGRFADRAIVEIRL